MSLATLRAELEAVLTDHLGVYTDVSVNLGRTVGPAFWQGADVPRSYRVDTLEAVLQYAGFEKDPPESEDEGLQGTALYRLTLIQHGAGKSVEEPLYVVLEAFPDATPQPLVSESDLTFEQIGVIFTERINR